MSAPRFPIPTALAALAACAVFAAGCGNPDAETDVRDDDGLAADSQAVSTPSWDAPTCGEPGLQPPALGSCAGPWQYKLQPSVTSPDPTCGVSGCATYNSCTLWKNGVDPTPITGSEIGGKKMQTCQWDCPSNATSEEGCLDTGTECNPDDITVSFWMTDLKNAKVGALTTELNNSMNQETQGGPVPSARRTEVLGKISVDVTMSRVVKTRRYGVGRPGRKIVNRTDEVTAIVNWKKPRPATAQTSSCTCAVPAYSSCEHASGAKVTRFAAPGGMPNGSWISEQSCLTCDGMPIDTASGVQAKADCLLNNLTVPVDAAIVPGDTYRRGLVNRLKHLFEIRADLVSQATRNTILALYHRDYDEGASCHIDVPVDASCAALAATVGGPDNGSFLDGRMQACANLTWSGTPLNTIRSQLQYCLQTLEAVQNLPAGACRDAYRNIAGTTLRALVTRTMEVIRNTSPSGSSSVSLTGMDEALGNVDVFYKHAVVASSGDATWLDTQAGALLASLWDHVYAAGAALPDSPVTSANVDSVVSSLDNASLQSEYAVLAAAFAAGSSFDSPPLMSLVGDALRTTVDRLETISEIHDMVCRYRPCVATSTTQISELWRILASLNDRDALSAAVAAASHLSSQHPAVLDVFGAIATSHVNLERAYTTAGGGSLSNLLVESQPPHAARTLTEVVLLATARYNEFTVSGEYHAVGSRELHAGMQNKQLVINQLVQSLGDFNIDYQKFLHDRVDLVNGLIAQMRSGATEATLIGHIQEILHQQNIALGQKAGLEARKNGDTVSFAKYAEAFEAMRSTGIFDNNMAAQSTPLPTILISARDASFSGTHDTNIPMVRYPAPGGMVPWKQTLEEGDQLQMKVTGQWSPTCAMQRNGAIPTPDGSFNISGTDALTGPEGFMVGFTGSSFEARSWSADEAAKVFANAEICLKIKLGTPGIMELLLGAGMESWIQACAGLDISATATHTNSTGGEERTTASFQAGAHLPNTPYPDAPAGALLLVVTAKGTTYPPLDVQVVARDFTYVASRAVDTYLVVNDIDAGCSRRDDKLTVQGARITSLGSVSRGLSQAMAEALRDIENQHDAILRQGDLLQSEEELLRLRARQSVALHTGMDFTALPPAVQELFETWITAEMVSLHRDAEIARKANEIDAARMQLDGLRNDVTNTQLQTRLLTLIPRWQLRQLKNSTLAQSRRAVLRYLRDFIPPIYELRFPRALDQLVHGASAETSASSELASLEALDFSNAGDDLSETLLAFAGKVKSSLDVAVSDASDYGVFRVAVSFPDEKLYTHTGATPQPGCEMFNTCPPPAGNPPSSVWHAVELARAKQVWDALRARGVATFTIRPEDLYDIHGGTGILPCSQSAPIIRKMAIYASTLNGDDHDGLNFRPAMVMGREMNFPTATGVESYVKDDENWLFTSPPVLDGSDSRALTKLAASDATVAAGLSPFNDFNIDFHNWPTGTIQISTIKELVVVFELETHPIASGVAIDVCH